MKLSRPVSLVLAFTVVASAVGTSVFGLVGAPAAVADGTTSDGTSLSVTSDAHAAVGTAICSQPEVDDKAGCNAWSTASTVQAAAVGVAACSVGGPAGCAFGVGYTL